MNGRLSDHPLAELVREISDTGLSGALRLERERAKAVVYFDGGEVAAAVSNVRALRLVEVLRRSGAVDAARIYAAAARRRYASPAARSLSANSMPIEVRVYVSKARRTSRQRASRR